MLVVTSDDLVDLLVLVDAVCGMYRMVPRLSCLMDHFNIGLNEINLNSTFYGEFCPRVGGYLVDQCVISHRRKFLSSMTL